MRRPLYTETSFFLLRRHPNVYCDISSVPPKSILQYYPWLERVADKAMFGSDWPGPGIHDICLVELADVADAEHRRYSMHETIRQFAQEQLRGSDQEADALEHHARYYTQLVSHAAENRAGQPLGQRLRTVQDDHDNL